VEAERRTHDIAEAVERLGSGDCVSAFRILDALPAGQLGGVGLETLAQAAWLCGDLDACLSAYDRAFPAYLAEGNQRRAGYVALMLSWEHAGRLAQSVAAGWLRRAERLLEPESDSAEFGYLTWFLSRGHLADEGVLQQLDLALELAQRHGDRPSWASHPSRSDPHYTPLRKPPILLPYQTTPERGLSRAEGRQSSVMLRPGAGE
jgi:hypothetical protein